MGDISLITCGVRSLQPLCLTVRFDFHGTVQYGQVLSRRRLVRVGNQGAARLQNRHGRPVPPANPRPGEFTA